ncbi:hypothetical protein E4U14_008111 [Claviceps sp. LM454 group G7]|nr:hypothetical protein E4U14_008111 [Claviceps sp. LM454 group G7]
MSRFCGYITKDWKRSRDYVDPHKATTTEVDNKIANLYSHYVQEGKGIHSLRDTFCEDCEDWTLATWKKASFRTQQALWDLLTTNKIHVGGRPGRNGIALGLHHAVTRYIHGDSPQEEEPQKPENELPFNERVDLVTEDGNSRPAFEANQPLQYQIYRQQKEVADTTARLEAAQLATRKLKQHPFCKEESSVDFINEDPFVDLCEESGSDDTFLDDPVKQKGKEKETLPEGFTSCSTLKGKRIGYTNDRYLLYLGNGMRFGVR